MRNVLLLICLLLCPVVCLADETTVWQVLTTDGSLLTEICYEPAVDDEYIAADNTRYRIIRIDHERAYAQASGMAVLPVTDWLDADAAQPVMSAVRRIAIYCTHSDESYEPSDGYYSTRERGSIYQVAQRFAAALMDKGIKTNVADTLHHPHDAGAYRRSRQTAIQLLKDGFPDCLIDIHRDGIPDPASYAVTIGGEAASKIRLLVGRGNQNAELNKEFALLIKAVADKVYPGLIKDIYMGKGAFNQDLLPRSILLECGTYTLEKERVFTSMPLMADVFNRALYGGVIGSVGRSISDVQGSANATAPVTQGQSDSPVDGNTSGVMEGFGFLGLLLGAGIIGLALLAAGSWKRWMHKAGRSFSEMTGGLIGKKPDQGEDQTHS